MSTIGADGHQECGPAVSGDMWFRRRGPLLLRCCKQTDMAERQIAGPDGEQTDGRTDGRGTAAGRTYHGEQAPNVAG